MDYQPRAWHATAAAAAVCLIGGSAAAVTVCKPAPTVAAPAPAKPPGKGIIESINDGLDSLILDELKPTTTTTAPRPSSGTNKKINDALDGLDAAVAPTYSVTAVSSEFPQGTNAAYTKCSVKTGKTTLLSATEASCLINTGSFTAAGTPPPGSIKPGVKANAAGEVCGREKPTWFWYSIPLGLLTIVLGWGSLKAGRRDGWGSHDTSQFADLPEPPAPPTFDPPVAGDGQPTSASAPPRGGKHTYNFDSFDYEDF